jgi:prepilin-type N-terminal cleavage/methylation domain-containing protein
MTRRFRPQPNTAGFTLIELLVVMAITAIIMGLIFGPMMQGFNLTTRARIQVETQASARRVSELGQRDLSEAFFVFDNSTQPIHFWVRQPDAQGRATGAPIPAPVSYAVLDLVDAARLNDQNPSPPGEDIDPTTGQLAEDKRGPIAQPLSPGRTITRWFVGLRDNATQPDSVFSTTGQPVRPYTNFYDNPRVYAVQNHNPFILYRAVVAPYTPGGAVDTRLFPLSNGQLRLFDPNFFYDNREAAKPNDPAVASAAVSGWRDDNGDGKINVAENWKAVSRAMVPTDRADEVTVEKDDNKNPIFFTYQAANQQDPTDAARHGKLIMKIASLVSFQPSYMGNDAGVATSTSDPGNEAVAGLPPSSHKETYGHWTRPYNLYVYRSSLEGPDLDFFYHDGGSGPILRRAYNTQNNTTSTTTVNFWPSRYNPLVERVDPANPPLQRNNPPQMMFSADARRGVVNFAFPYWIWMYDAQGRPEIPAYDPEVVNQEFNARAFDPVTGAFNPDAQRYISLKTLPAAVGKYQYASPLTAIPNVMIVPGSEVIYGPDQRPGPHYGKRILYTRIPLVGPEIGPNEYKIRYTDIPNGNPADPMQAMGTIEFARGTDPAQGGPNPQARPGVGLPVNSYAADGTLTGPAADITVAFQIQNNRSSDSVKADYLTRQLVNFTAGVRLYDFGSGQAQQVNLTQRIAVRNQQR